MDDCILCLDTICPKRTVRRYFGCIHIVCSECFHKYTAYGYEGCPLKCIDNRHIKTHKDT